MMIWYSKKKKSSLKNYNHYRYHQLFWGPIPPFVKACIKGLLLFCYLQGDPKIRARFFLTKKNRALNFGSPCMKRTFFFLYFLSHEQRCFNSFVHPRTTILIIWAFNNILVNHDLTTNIQFLLRKLNNMCGVPVYGYPFWVAWRAFFF